MRTNRSYASSRTRYPIRLGIGLTAALLAVTGCSGAAVDGSEDEGSSSDPLKVGLLLPLAGPYAAIGEEVKNGFELYLSQHDQKLGSREVKITEADEGADPAVGIPAAQRLINESNVDVVSGVVSSAVASGIRDTFHDAKVPLVLSVAATSGEPSPYIWRTSQTTTQPGMALGPYLAKENLESVYLIGADYVAGRDNVGAFAKAYTAAGGKIAGESFTPFRQTQDWQPFLASIKKSGASAVYAFYAGSEATNFVKQYKSFGLTDTVPLYGTGFLTEQDALPAQGKSAIDVLTSNNYSTELDTEINKQFVSDYKAEFGSVPSTYAMQSYDAAQLIDEGAGAQTGGVLTTKRLVKGLQSITKLESPRGEFSLDDNHNPVQNFYLRKVEESGGELINTVVADLGSTPAS